MGKQMKEVDLMKEIVSLLVEENLISSREQIAFLSALREGD